MKKIIASDIAIQDLDYFYGNTQVLFNINCIIPKGKIVVLLGSSGAGKTTLMRTLNFLEKPKKGILKITNHTYDCSKKLSDKDILTMRRKVGMVFQQYNLWPHKTVIENLLYAPKKLKLYSINDINNHANELLNRLNIKAHANKYPLQLSGGQQQRVAIARALMMKPEVLLFDEPTAALDPEITTQIANIIKELASIGSTQIIVTHDVSFAKKIAEYVIYMKDGKIVEMGDHNIFSSPQTQEFAYYLTH